MIHNEKKRQDKLLSCHYSLLQTISPLPYPFLFPSPPLIFSNKMLNNPKPYSYLHQKSLYVPKRTSSLALSFPLFILFSRFEGNMRHTPPSSIRYRKPKSVVLSFSLLIALPANTRNHLVSQLIVAYSTALMQMKRIDQRFSRSFKRTQTSSSRNYTSNNEF